MILNRLGMTSRQQRIVLSSIALCIAILIAFLQGDDGTARDAAAPASRTLAPQEAARPDQPAATKAEARAAAIAKAIRWLELQEDGSHHGHTIARHVGKSDADLRARIVRDDVAVASGFYDLETAAVAIVRTIRHEPNDRRIRKWLDDDESKRRLALRRTFTKPLGRIVHRDGGARDGRSVVAVLTKQRTGQKAAYRLLTAYVEP